MYATKSNETYVINTIGLGLFNGSMHLAQLSLKAEKSDLLLGTLSYVVKIEKAISGLSVAEKGQVMAHFEGLPKAYPSMGKSFNYFHSWPLGGQKITFSGPCLTPEMR